MYYTNQHGNLVDISKPKLRWPLGAEGYILLKHGVRRETVEALMETEDLTLTASRFGRLMLQGTVNGKCYRLVVEVEDSKEWILEPVTAYRYAAGDQKRGGKP